MSMPRENREKGNKNSDISSLLTAVPSSLSTRLLAPWERAMLTCEQPFLKPRLSRPPAV